MAPAGAPAGDIVVRAAPRPDPPSEPPRPGGAPGGGAARRYRHIGWQVALTDALIVVAVLLLVDAAGHGPRRVPPDLALVMALAPLAWVGVFHAFGLYAVRHLPATEEFRRIIGATSVGVVLIMLATAWWADPPSQLWFVAIWGLAFVLEMLARRVWRWNLRRLRRDGPLAMRTLIVGTNDEAVRVARILASPARGFSPVGHVATAAAGAPDTDLPVLGDISTIEEAIAEHGVECLFVSSTAVSPKEMLALYRACRRARVEMSISANIPDILTSRLTMEPLGDVMAVSLRPVRLTGAQAVVKRSFDLVVASVGFVLALPVMAAIALVIRVTSGSPVLFRQRRVTRDGKVFTMLKFRTMVPEADRGVAGATVDLTEPFFKLRDDPRLTRVGRHLRSFSLDELPQLWNVLRGEMSLVGPRPLRVEQVDSDPEILAPRHEVKAGITGWWQINGRNDLGYEQSVRMDLFYVENWSLSLDLYILLKTLGAALARRGAY